MKLVWAACSGIVIALMVVACGPSPQATPTAAPTPTREEESVAFALSSKAFRPDGAIPSRHSCDGEDVSPALSWSEAPEGTQAFALIMDDPDAPAGVFTHWVLFNLPADACELPEGVAKTERLESGALQGRNDFGAIGYGGPCPPPGMPHRYRFVLYALDSPLDLGPEATKGQVLDRMQGHILGEARLVGAYQR